MLQSLFPMKRKADPTWERRESLKRLYAITPEQYDALYAAQSGLCAICHEPESIEVKKRNPWTLAVDHDHETGAIRGLLCNRCNYLEG